MQYNTTKTWRPVVAAVVAVAVLLAAALTLATHPAGANAEMPGCPLGNMSVCLMGVVEHFGSWRTTFAAVGVATLAAWLVLALWWQLRQVVTLAVVPARWQLGPPDGFSTIPERDYLRVNLARGLLHPKRF